MKSAEINTRIISGVFFSVIGFLWPVLLALFTTPYIVAHLGLEGYGLLSLVISVSGFLALLDLGMGNATVKYVSEYLARGDMNAVNTVMGTTLTIYGLIGIIGGTMAWVLTPFLVSILNIPESMNAVAQASFFVGAIGFLTTMVAGVYAAVIKAKQRFDLYSLVSVVLGTVTTLGIVYLLFLGHGVLIIVTFNVVIGIVSIGVYARLSRYLVPGIQLRPSFDLVWFRKLYRFGVYSMVASFGGIVCFQMNKLMLGVISGPAAVALFAVPQNLAMKIHGLAAKSVEVYFPVASELHSTNRMSSLESLYLSTMRLLSVIVLTTVPPLVPLSYSFLFLWLGKEFATDAWAVFALLLLAYMMLTFSVVPFNLLQGIGKPRILAVFAVIESVGTILLGLLLIPRFGAVGAAAVTLFVYFDVFVGLYYMESRVLGLRGIFTLQQIYLRPLVAGLFGYLLASWLAPVINGWISFFAVYASGVAMALVINMLLGSARTELRILGNYVAYRFRA